MRLWLHLDEFAFHVLIDLIAAQLSFPDLALDDFDFPGLFIDLYGDEFMDVGLDEEIEGFLSFGINLSLEFG